MFIIISLLLLGVGVGYLFRNNNLKWISKLIMALIWLLLFILGVEVGENEEIMKGLHTIGIEALIITVAAVLGSIIGAKLLWNWIKKNESTKK